MSPEILTARQLTRRLIDREEAPGANPDARAAAVHSASEKVSGELCRWVGKHGCHILFTRAVSEARSEYPILAAIHVRASPESAMDGIPETIKSHGPAATAEALESVLATLLGLLSRLVGDDMVMRLLGQGIAQETREHAKHDERRPPR